MQPYRLLTLGFAAILAGIATFGLAGPAQAGALAAQGASGANKAITRVGDGNVVEVAKRHSKRLRRSNRIRRHKGIRRHTGVRRHTGLRRHSGVHRHKGIHRHRAHKRYGRKRHRRSSLIFSYSHPYPYGYGSSYYDYGYGYPYYSYADPYYPPAAYVVPRSSRSARRASYRGSCRKFGVGTRSWVRCCSRKYRSFNRSTGKYRTYSGRYRTCR